MNLRRAILTPALATTAALALAACGSGSGGTAPAPGGPATLSVVASTDVYGAIAQAVGGDAVTVTSIINSPDADPHEYESRPADAVAVNEAEVVVYNGAGYDDFATKLLDASSAKPAAIDVSALSGLETAGAPFNEHVWYSLPTVEKLADKLAADLTTADPARASTFAANAAAFNQKIDALTAKLDAIKAKYAGQKVAITEPVPLYLVQAAGLVDATPAEFSEAVEEGTDPPAAVLAATLATFQGADKVKVLLPNAQTETPLTKQVEQAATAGGVPIVPVTETLPAGVTDYVTWMTRQIDGLGTALGGA